MTRLRICFTLLFSLSILSCLQSDALPQRNTLPIRFETTGPKVQESHRPQQMEESVVKHSSHGNTRHANFSPLKQGSTKLIDSSEKGSTAKEQHLVAKSAVKKNKRCCKECKCKECHCGENGHHCCSQCPCGKEGCGKGDCCGGCCNDECDGCNICYDCCDPCSNCCCCESCGRCWCGCCDRDDWECTAEGKPCCYNPCHPTWHYWPNFTPERWYYVTHHTHHYIKHLRGCGRH